ncbi:putative quinol monooxygenase [Evansella cellulosilytica]|uniref:Antibiotic biosynthesis monooxygenase n=1 Tax=Evansella cellulosilytica (strain ATCC 21833 / DSM 2522 / FERM P-1141 / JCM 9156 / N-4) TaxID=649639 RepID=E6TW65_EVAC2|nr:putative quinol monooxygenase [Evansella cellulosilytica]ADU31021.1 Antibiotic biosynthesis monooxygenase [Evansella cellulosilytica DSM 2522]
MHIIHAHIHVKEEKRDAFLEEVKPLITGSQAEEGNITYRLYEDTEAPNQFVMLEEWVDQKAIDIHNETEHFKNFGKKAKDYFKQAPEVKVFAVTEQ